MKIKVDKMPKEKEQCIFSYEDHDLMGMYVVHGFIRCKITKKDCDLKNKKCSVCKEG